MTSRPEDAYTREETAGAAPGCFEIALTCESYPADARLVVGEPWGEVEIPISQGFDGGDGYVSFRHTGIQPDHRYTLSYKQGSTCATFFTRARLADYMRESEGPSESFMLAVRVVTPSGGTIPITAASLAGVPLANGDALPDWGLDIHCLGGGAHTLQVEAGGPHEVALQLQHHQGDEPNLTFSGQRPDGVYMTRIRAGSPGNWSVVYFLLTIVVEARFALFVPCTGTGKEHRDFMLICESGRRFYQGKGFARVDIVDVTGECRWETVCEHLEQAAAEGVRYERMITVGHGGWDGPIFYDNATGESRQVSPHPDPGVHPEVFPRVIEALRKGLTANAKMFISNCHCGGANVHEFADQNRSLELTEEFHQQMLRELREAEEALALDPTDQAALQKRDNAQANIDIHPENVRTGKKLRDYRWAVDVAQRTGRFVAGPAGLTSTGYTAQHYKAILEGTGNVRQEIWVGDGPEGKLYKVPPSGFLRKATAQPLEVEPQPSAEEAVVGGVLPLSLPEMLLMPLAPR